MNSSVSLRLPSYFDRPKFRPPSLEKLLIGFHPDLVVADLPATPKARAWRSAETREPRNNAARCSAAHEQLGAA